MCLASLDSGPFLISCDRWWWKCEGDWLLLLGLNIGTNISFQCIWKTTKTFNLQKHTCKDLEISWGKNWTVYNFLLVFCHCVFHVERKSCLWKACCLQICYFVCWNMETYSVTCNWVAAGLGILILISSFYKNVDRTAPIFSYEY